MTETKSIPVFGLQKEEKFTVHLMNPRTGKSGCGFVHQDDDDISKYRLDIACPSFVSMCGGCIQAIKSVVGEIPEPAQELYLREVEKLKETMTEENPEITTDDYELSEEKRQKIQRLIGQVVDDELQPAFYSLSGSHLYGYPSEGSDIDVRGFHIAPMDQYAKVGEPTEQIRINHNGSTTGFGAYEEIDFVSYELRKFGKMVVAQNPHVVEWMFNYGVIINNAPNKMQELRKTIEKGMPLKLPKRYEKMAEGQFDKYLNCGKDDDEYDPSAKKYLMIIKWLLQAKFIQDNGLIEPRVKVLSDSVLGGSDLVDDLIEWKMIHGDKRLNRQLEDDAHALTVDLINSINLSNEYHNPDFTKSVNQWMLDVREKTSD